jgi:spore germination cell wall hydrolase CwlJ-like protein
MTFEMLSESWSSNRARGAAAIGAIIGLSLVAVVFVSSRSSALPTEVRRVSITTSAPPIPPPLVLRDMAPAEALEVNRRIPISTQSNTPAAPFKLRGGRTSFDRAVECLATAIYYEAGDESLDGQRAVAQVVLNRVRHPAFVPTVCGVVYQGSTRSTGCQFSFTCDGSLNRVPDYSGWRRARAIAVVALRGSVFAPVGHATHYHADYVVPYWASTIAKNAVIGRHIFYQWPQWWGTAAAFSRKYAGVEDDPRLLRVAAVALTRQRQEAEAEHPPQIRLPPDRYEDLIRVIQVLAAKSPVIAHQSAYDLALGQHFSRYSEHLAVQIYRQLSAESGFDAALLVESLKRLSERDALTRSNPRRPDSAAAPDETSRLIQFEVTLMDFAEQSRFEDFARAGNARIANGPAQHPACDGCKT